ncbi:hypothetical protein [Bradyrhizobium japonicum]|uniref:hypothetical protein n=1 Tax=Bradyrhizobium japonicum TaxID=375 RepID=UPI001269F32B|nr:hypothetical protein [Bradyrhizobium japonicum]
MRNNTVKGLLLDAANAIELGRLGLAHRLISLAERIAAADRTIPARRIDAIRTARLAVAIAI